MLETETESVKVKAVGSSPAVFHGTDHRVPRLREMHANLIFATRLEGDFDEGMGNGGWGMGNGGEELPFGAGKFGLSRIRATENS